jgi:AcrR family transcriptional regulator
MPKVLPEYLELRRQQILDAAATCFARKGFHPTTMQDICHEAELSPGAVYRYFPSKESIIQAMCSRSSTSNVQAIQESMGERDTQAIFVELIKTFFVEVESYQRHEDCALNVELIAEAQRSEPIREWLTASLHNTRTLFTDVIRAAQTRGEINAALNAESVAQVMVATYHGFITQTLVEPDIDVDGYAAVLKALFNGTFWKDSGPAEGAGSALLH